MSELLDITAIMLESISAKLPASSVFNLWFGNFELISLTDEKAVFSTPTPLKKKVLTNKYMDIISEALESAIGFNVNIEISCPDTEKIDTQRTVSKTVVTVYT